MSSSKRGRAIVIPVKPLRIAKSRLSPHLDPASRETLALRMARRVTYAAESTGADVYVVTVDDEVAKMAAEVFAHVVSDPQVGVEYGPGTPQALNSALEAGLAVAMDRGAQDVLIVPADLPHISPGDLIAAMNRPGPDGISIAPSIDGDGTNALALPIPPPISLSFGPSSFIAHISQAIDYGIPVRVLRRRGLVYDVDTPSAAESIMRAGFGA
jgi:2-phospho-L-lactate guanylyltransferase